MNLIDAVKSGRPFRRRHHSAWYEKFDGCLSERFRMGPNGHCELVMGDVIADDYELQEPEVRITRAQFWEAVRESLDACAEYERQCTGGYHIQKNEMAELAKRLGLEP